MLERSSPVPVLVLPGMDGTGELVTALVERLREKRPVKIVSYPTDEPIAYDDLVTFVGARVPQDRFVLVAESFSGPVAIEIAAVSSSVAGLVLASSFVRHPAPPWIAAFAGMLSPSWLPKRLAASMLMGSLSTRELQVRLAHALASVSDATLSARIAAALSVDKRARLREVASPILCLYGKRDRIVGKRQWAEINAIQPESQVRWFDAPHMLLETRADQAAEAVNAFCDRVM